MRKLRVFLCHSSGDKPAVRDLYHRLCDENVESWLDEEDLLPGQDWEVEIRNAIKTIDIVIVCLSKGAINKTGYVQKEIKFALDEADKQPEGTIFIIPVKLEACDMPERLSRWQYVNLLEEKAYQKLMQALKYRANALNLIAPGKTGIQQEVPEKGKTEPLLQQKAEPTPSAKVVTKPTTLPSKSEQKQRALRSKPRENLTVDDVESMLKEKGLFDVNRNKSAPGFPNKYELQKDGRVVYDYASGLMWQQSGSTKSMTYENAKAYVEALNSHNFAGYKDWRLPTLEEAMSLMESTEMNGGLYIDPTFDKQQQWIWTSDTYSASSAWVVVFGYGGCGYSFDFNYDSSVRAVR
jgi:hypothetical protein